MSAALMFTLSWSSSIMAAASHPDKGPANADQTHDIGLTYLHYTQVNVWQYMYRVLFLSKVKTNMYQKQYLKSK